MLYKEGFSLGRLFSFSFSILPRRGGGLCFCAPMVHDNSNGFEHMLETYFDGVADHASCYEA